jgi:hypothetical protein
MSDSWPEPEVPGCLLWRRYWGEDRLGSALQNALDDPSPTLI